MKPLIPAAAAAALAAAALAATASGASAPATLRLTQIDHHFKLVDVAPRGGDAKPPSQGDELVIGGRLRQGGRSAGSSNLVCTVTQPGRRAVADCTGTLVLRRGDISFAGVSAFAKQINVAAVTGGTGDYAGATGVVTTSDGSGSRTAITVELGS
jgi:hypothetical protein